MLDVIFRDETLIAIHKPAGLMVHRSMLDRHEIRFAVQLLRDQIGRHVFPAHRLDRGTSGILLFALDRSSAAQLGQAFEQRLVEKRYLAIVRGHPSGCGVIDHPLARQPDEQTSGTTAAPGAPRDARTGFRTVAKAELPYRVDRYPASRYAMLELTPRTGRRHQIRRHLKHVSHPIIGDATYGKGRHNRLFAELFGVNRLLLACTGLSFPHPLTGESVVLSCPPSDDFMQVVRALGWQDTMHDALPMLTDS